MKGINKLFLVINGILLIFSFCCIIQIRNHKCSNAREYAIKKDLKIMMGDANEYGLCNVSYAHDSLSTRDYMLYSFIMADKYHDDFAAQQFADIIIHNIVLDSSMTYFLLDYLFMAVDSNKPSHIISRSSAAFQLSEWYAGKNAYILPNDSISMYYDSIGKQELMRRSETFEMKTQL